ncbi:hypothetical protein ACWF82_11225 [Nocardia sp. NPDC055053]
MIDHETARPLDEVPEADRIEQEQTAFTAGDPDDPAFSDAGGYSDQVAANVDRDAFSANPADVIEQTIAVPFDDEFVEGEEP